MTLLLKMLFVPGIVIAALAIWGVIYTRKTGKPFIVINGGEKTPETESDDKIVDHVSLESIEGLWRMISVGRNGNFAPPEVIERADVSMVILGNTLTLTNTLELNTLKLNSDVVPNELDQTDDKGETHLCIVRMRNANLEICQAEVGRPRPTNFNRRRRDGASLTLFQLVASGDDLEQESEA